MSCPDWTTLLAARERDPLADPPGWREAREHLRGCPLCRETALALDPALLFLHLPAPRRDEGEIAAMQHGVATLIRAGRVAERATRRRAVARRLAAAIALVVTTLALEPSSPPVSPALAEARAWSAALAELPAQPLIDELDLAQARVYELGSDGLAVVMVVDDNLDV